MILCCGRVRGHPAGGGWRARAVAAPELRRASADLRSGGRCAPRKRGREAVRGLLTAFSRGTAAEDAEFVSICETGLAGLRTRLGAGASGVHCRRQRSNLRANDRDRMPSEVRAAESKLSVPPHNLVHEAGTGIARSRRFLEAASRYGCGNLCRRWFEMSRVGKCGGR
jgi:hypothetical protein